MIQEPSTKKRILSGIRATGKIHLGNYHGALKNWVKLQHEYDCFFMIADLHALTSDYATPKDVAPNTWAMAVDCLAAGIDPEKATFFVQSHVPEHSALSMLLGMITPLGWLERVPTYKDQQQKLKDKDLSTYGFLGYPVLMTADIALYQANLVPVGEDQVPHLEFSREIIRRFHHLYGHEIFPEPKPLLTKVPVFPGLDGIKMSKSLGNTILLRENKDVATKKIKTMPTDPARIRRTDPGDPAKCPVWKWHLVYSDDATKEWVQKGCKSASIGCLECKQPIVDAVCGELEAVCERIEYYENNRDLVWQILSEGAKKARVIAKETLEKVEHVMGLIGEHRR